MVKFFKQKSQSGFIGTILLSQILALSLGALYVQKEIQRLPSVPTPVVETARSVDVAKLLITPKEILEQKEQSILSSLVVDGDDSPSSVQINDQKEGLEFEYTPLKEEVAGLDVGSDKGNLITLLAYNFPEQPLPIDEEDSVDAEVMGEEIAEANPKAIPTATPLGAIKLPKKTPTPTQKAILASSIEKIVSTPEPTVKPTTTPTVTPASTPKPTEKPTEKPTAPPEQTAAVVAAANTTKPASLNAELIFQMINDHRAKIGKPAFEKDAKLCAIAESRGPELYDEIFVNHNIHAGFKARNLPYWITENMVSYGSEQANFNWWMNSSIHRSAIEGDYKYSCGTCWGNSCAQLFTSWVPK